MYWKYSIKNLSDLQRCLDHLKTSRQLTRPYIAVSYAQSIDGSIATADRRPLAISGRESMRLTHQLRAIFDGILVGINTVVADDPQLTVRLAQGPNPQPVVLDTHLRTPIDCGLMRRPDRRSWVASSRHNSNEKVAAITRAGAVNLSCPIDGSGLVDLHALVGKLYEMGVCSLMVEGGAKVITSFIRARLIDQFVITIAPMLIGGLQPVSAPFAHRLQPLSLQDVHYQQLGEDMVCWARPVWSSDEQT